MTQESRYPCPCRGYHALSERGGYDICPVCFWEDEDPLDTDGNPARNRALGANAISLEQARRNFAIYGAMEERFKKHVRGPLPAEIRPTGRA